MELDLARIFVKVAQHGSLTRAAEVLKVPKSTISRALTKLEEETGTKLLLRTTRSLTLTPAGRSFFEASLGPITQLEDAHKSLYGQDNSLTGVLRITAPEDLGSLIIAPAIAALSLQHPQLQFDLLYTDKVVDLIKEGFDIAVRMGKTVDSSLRLKKAGEINLITVASPDYLKRKQKLRAPQDLKEHDCLALSSSPKHWTLKSEKTSTTVLIHPKIKANQMTSLLQMAIAHGGVALIPKFLCKEALLQGTLVHVLPKWSTPGVSISLISPLPSSASARLKITLNHLHAALQTALRPHQD